MKYISPRKCWWIYRNWAIHLLKSRMAFIANCFLYRRKETGSLISSVNFFSFMTPATALNIPSAFLTQLRDGSELQKHFEEDSSRTTCCRLGRRCWGERGSENWPQKMSLLGLHRIIDPFVYSIRDVTLKKSISQWAIYLQWLGWNDFEIHWVVKAHGESE